ncbi:MAG: hypothetical protein WCY52_08140 [Sphaerochaetaceae bacterium]
MSHRAHSSIKEAKLALVILSQSLGAAPPFQGWVYPLELLIRARWRG